MSTPFGENQNFEKSAETDFYCKYNSANGKLVILLDDFSVDGFVSNFTISGFAKSLIWTQFGPEKYLNPAGEESVFPVTKKVRTGFGENLHLKVAFVIFDDVVEYHMRKHKMENLKEGRKKIAKIFNTIVRDEMRRDFRELNLDFHLLDIKFLSSEEAERILTKWSAEQSLNDFNSYQQ